MKSVNNSIRHKFLLMEKILIYTNLQPNLLNLLFLKIRMDHSLFLISLIKMNSLLEEDITLILKSEKSLFQEIILLFYLKMDNFSWQIKNPNLVHLSLSLYLSLYPLIKKSSSSLGEHLFKLKENL